MSGPRRFLYSDKEVAGCLSLPGICSGQGVAPWLRAPSPSPTTCQLCGLGQGSYCSALWVPHLQS